MRRKGSADQHAGHSHLSEGGDSGGDPGTFGVLPQEDARVPQEVRLGAPQLMCFSRDHIQGAFYLLLHYNFQI